MDNHLLIVPGSTVPNPNPANQPDPSQCPSGAQAGATFCQEGKGEEKGLDQI